MSLIDDRTIRAGIVRIEDSEASLRRNLFSALKACSHLVAIESLQSRVYLFNVARTSGNPGEPAFVDLHISEWVAQIPERSVSFSMGAVEDS